METKQENYNFDGKFNASQKIEHIKNLESLWNEYFTSIVYYQLNTRGDIPKGMREGLYVQAGIDADLMLKEYKFRFVVDNGN